MAQIQSDAFEMAAQAGDADGAFNLGRMYEWRQVTRAVAVSESSGEGEGGSGGGAVGGRHRHLLRVAASTSEDAKEAAQAEWVDAATHWHGVALDGYNRLGDACA